jgi:hypothetical protein
MSATLDRIRAKVTRAKQHIQEFQVALGAFHDSRPYEVRAKENAETGKRIYYVARVNDVPDHVTTIVADVLQNLRAPLDQIAYQLVLDARGGSVPDWDVYYPISRTAADYPSTRKSKIKGVRQAVVDAIDATEPYQGGKGHALWQLNMLNRFDKHKLLFQAAPVAAGIDIVPTVVGLMADTKFAAILAKSGPLFVREVGPLRPLHEGDELYIEPIESKVDEKRQFRFEIALHDPGVIDGEPALKTVQDMANLVDAIVVTLGKFLP